MAEAGASTERRLHAIVSGRVQGVGYRVTTFDEARRLRLAGWVRNRWDGTVEVLAEGNEATLRLFLDYLHRGPWGASVTSVAEEWSEAAGAPQPFQVKHTA
ncbi:MAG: acylphosphatase [Deltaproteobacteria bacterium]|nr:acylphosphatase [Deltaproteobacteria bacterium]